MTVNEAIRKRRSIRKFKPGAEVSVTVHLPSQKKHLFSNNLTCGLGTVNI